jgi:uncharacterized membrane protein YqgA involved in biofilm formation
VSLARSFGAGAFYTLNLGRENYALSQMVGPILNAAGIVIGGLFGLLRPARLSPVQEGYIKLALAGLTIFYGLRLTWLSFSGTFWQILKQVLVMIVAMMIGKFLGRLLQFQKMSNHLGQLARESMSRVRPNDPNRASEGFKTCAALFCAPPLGLVGAMQDGLTAYWYPLAVKAFIDGFAAMGFVALFGWSVLLSGLPVLALYGTLSVLGAYFAGPLLAAHGLSGSVNAVSGVLIFSVALVMLGIKKIELTDYLPSLVIAPLLTLLFR